MHECSTSKLSAFNPAAGTNHHLLKCVARVIFFNILFLLGVSCKSTDTCAGLNTPGVTIPQGDIILESGSSLTIYCLLNQSHKASQGKNASDLNFYHNEKLLPPEFVDVINSTAIKLYIKEPVPSYSMYYCRLRGDYGKDIAVCLNGVAVGYKPQEVQNFSCVSRNWQNLTCTWKKPVNYVNTSYKLTFKLPGRAGGRMHHACPLNMDEQKNYCFWDITTEPHYRQPYEYYYFTMTGRNIFGNLTTQYKFHHYAHVIPAPAEKLNIREYTPHSAFLEWHVPFPMQTFPPGLIHRVEYQSQWDKRDQWFTANTSRLNPHHPYQSFNLSNLKYANSLYDVRIYLKSPAAVGEDKWSWPTNTTFKTERDVPEMPPKTDIGSYEVSGGAPMYRDVYIYWQYIPEYLKNGDYFEYRIISVKENDQERFLVPNETTKAYAKFKGLTFNSYQFVVASANEKGLSREKSVVSVPSKRESPPEPKSFTKIDFGNGTYELSWKPQETNDDSKRIENYTIFWCDNERDRPYQCTGFLNWTHVPGNETLKSIVVPEKKIYQFAIAANSKNHSSGMVWASCTVIHNKVVGKMKSVWINRIGSTFIEVGWRLDCSDRIGTVQGFKIYYCPIVSPYNFSCKEPEKSTTVKGDPATLHGNVTNLKPYTTYMVAIAVITKLGEGSQSDPLYNTTLEAAPTPPPPAQITNVTNTSMVVTWEPPHSMNGALRYYEIHYGFHKKRIEMGTKAKQETLPMEVKLENLTSHMNYSVSVIACTVQCSEKSTPVTVQTDIGVPGEMDSPVVQFINASLAVVTWKPPRERGGLLNYYEVKVVKMYEKFVNETFIYNTTVNSSQIQLPECETDGYLKYRFSVRAVNIGNNNITYKGNWSVPGETNCYRSVLPYPVIVFIWVCGFLVAGALAILVCYLGKKAWLRCKEMQVVEVKLPPGLAPNEKEKDNEYGSLNWPPIDTHDHLMPVKPRSNTSADEELLLQKKEERHGRNPSGDSSGCSSAHESVSSSLTSGTQISSDSGTEVDQRPPSPDGVFPDSPTWEATSLRQRNVTSMRGDGNSSDGSSWDPYVKMGRSGSVNGRGGSSSVARSTPNLTDIESLGLTPGTSGIGYSCLGTWSSTGYISMPSSEEMGSGSGSGSGSGMVGGYCRVGLDGQPVQGQALSHQQQQQQQQQQHHQIQMQQQQQPSQPNKGYVSLASMPSTSNTNNHPNLQQIHNMPQGGGYVAHQPVWSSAPKETTGSGKGYVMAGEMGSGGLLGDADQEDQGILDSLSSAEEQEDSLQSPESYCRLGLHPTARLPVSTQLGIGVTGRSDGTIEAVRERAQKKPSSGYVTLSDISQPSTAGSAVRDERQASTNNSTVSGYVPHRQFEKREPVAQDHHLYTKVFPPSDQGNMKSPTASV